MGTPPVVRLANDIAEQFASKPHDVGVAAVAQHITTFWDPRMRTQLLEVAEAGGSELSPLARDAAAVVGSPLRVEPLRFDTVLATNEGTTDE